MRENSLNFNVDLDDTRGSLMDVAARIDSVHAQMKEVEPRLVGSRKTNRPQGYGQRRDARYAVARHAELQGCGVCG